MQVEGTVDISGLVGDSSLLVQVAELRSGGGVSRALLNRTVNVNVPLISMQENSKCNQLLYIICIIVPVSSFIMASDS